MRKQTQRGSVFCLRGQIVDGRGRGTRTAQVSESDELILCGLPGDSQPPFPVLMGSSPHSYEAAAAPLGGGVWKGTDCVKTQACGHPRSQEPLEMGRHSGRPGDSVGRGARLTQVLLAFPGPGEGAGAFTAPRGGRRAAVQALILGSERTWLSVPIRPCFEVGDVESHT